MFYHSANDVPLALAPNWGFIDKNDSVWQATVEFAFSPANKNGYFDKNRLGSIHTPSPWPLGDSYMRINSISQKWNSKLWELNKPPHNGMEDFLKLITKKIILFAHVIGLPGLMRYMI